MDEFEKELRLKRNDQKYSVKAKLEKHLHKQGLNKKIVSELMKFTSEQYWPKPIRNEKLRIQNKRIIETYSQFKLIFIFHVIFHNYFLFH